MENPEINIHVRNPEDQPKQKLPFAAEKESRQFMTKVIQIAVKGFDEHSIVPSTNLLIFYHGRRWNTQWQEKDGCKPQSGELKLVSNQCAIKIDRILSHDLSLLSDFIQETTGTMGQSMSQRAMTSMVDSAMKTGQTLIRSKDGSLADGFLEMVKKTEMLVDSTGKVSLPTLFCPPGVAEQLTREIEERGPEFQKTINDIRKDKEQKALAREAQRVAQYDSP
jgi:hypothetical protein